MKRAFRTYNLVQSLGYPPPDLQTYTCSALAHLSSNVRSIYQFLISISRHHITSDPSSLSYCRGQSIDGMIVKYVQRRSSTDYNSKLKKKLLKKLIEKSIHHQSIPVHVLSTFSIHRPPRKKLLVRHHTSNNNKPAPRCC
jgi:hypothetical protein